MKINMKEKAMMTMTQKMIMKKMIKRWILLWWMMMMTKIKFLRINKK